MLYYLAVIVYTLVCLTLVLVVLLQQGKGGSMANAFGGGGSTQAAFGARSGATVLSRATTVCAILFIAGALMLGIMRQRGPGSVVGGRAAPQTQQNPTSSPAVPPQTPAPQPAR